MHSLFYVFLAEKGPFFPVLLFMNAYNNVPKCPPAEQLSYLWPYLNKMRPMPYYFDECDMIKVFWSSQNGSFVFDQVFV